MSSLHVYLMKVITNGHGIQIIADGQEMLKYSGKSLLNGAYRMVPLYFARIKIFWYMTPCFSCYSGTQYSLTVYG